ncbi:hypothetical protein M0R45_035540 [Rubus argutus]|uniref:Uncharacterized protein n=1 Tax=Rubus argutus TaxID=59490 RepID=A0AAW1VXT5_RUBAR
MIVLQCDALVRELNVKSLLCGLAGTIWLCLLAGTWVFNDDCTGHTLASRSLRSANKDKVEAIPVSYTLAISFLACHLGREVVLANLARFVNCSIELKLPYISIFLEIEEDLRQFGKPLRACRISYSLMCRHSESVPVQKLALLAALVVSP